jgi:integrase
MAKELLTTQKIKAITKVGPHRDGGGLRLIVTALGTKRWELWISINGKKRELGLGVFPDVSLKDARDEAERLKRAARDGIDLRAQRVLREARAVTFRQAFEDYFAIKCQQLSNAKHLMQWPSTMGAYVYPIIGDIPVSEVTADHVLEVLKPIWFDKPETAKRVLQRIEAVFKSAILRGSREKASPCVGVAGHLGTRHREQHHHASLPWQEVPDFVAMLQQPSRNGWPITRLAFEFLILTATRSGEVRCAVWAEFDFDNAVWEIPKGRMKSRRAHRVPLSQRCLQILRETRALNPDGQLVFEGTKRGRPLSDMTLTKFLRNGGLGEAATAHGFRSAFKNWCSETAKARDEVSEAALAHTIKDRVKAAYLRTDFFEERKSLMEAWSAHCQSRGRLKFPSNAEPSRLSVALA